MKRGCFEPDCRRGSTSPADILKHMEDIFRLYLYTQAVIYLPKNMGEMCPHVPHLLQSVKKHWLFDRRLYQSLR